ncbi:hypothetical protein GTP55_04555 [Duganella sp. FT109W]|uniref:Uncharacterized protein n=1 Tax=Duganella margarita TaxID=2692170 RepID=A0ABW9WCA1_9BURK|nr:hypothetical protein [Duganella margarita]MYN38638.1 hypothetical protein [Duganella margarita]
MTKFYSYYFEEIGFKFSFDKDDGADCPRWSETEDFPPLPPRAAIATSKAALIEMLSAYPIGEPQFAACALRRTSDYEGGWWYYDISWFVCPPECDGSDSGEIRVPVMMNGKCPPYAVFKFEDRRNVW